MVMDKPKRQMLEPTDWSILGHSYNPETPILPRCRVDVPFGPSAGDMHVTANKLAQLAEALHAAARMVELGGTHRSAIMDGMAQVRQTHCTLRRTKEDWERELRVQYSATLKGKEHLREVG